MFAIFKNLILVVVANSGFLAAVIALASFVYTSMMQREIEKNNMYQQLELASIEFFKWESSNRVELSKTRGEYPDVPAEDKILIEAYYTQAMNLFELCIHNKKTRTLPAKVFGSWLPWIHEFAHEPEFDKIWPEIRLHYLPECRKVMESAINNERNKFIIEMCEKHRLKKKDWVEYEPVEYESIEGVTQPDNTNVNIKKGGIKNIGKYLSIFNECKHNGYISHGEVLCGRATHDLKWADNIITQMKREFIHYILSKKCEVLEILLSGELAGFAIIELNTKVKAAVLSDIMIKKNCQGKGIGKEALKKIEAHIKNRNIGMILLESGIKNEKAHNFFEKNGYNQISAEFYKYLC